MITTAALRALTESLGTIESVAFVGAVSSTNDLARRVAAECVENDIPMPRAIIVAREQRQGRGRGSNNWVSPAGGIYATVLFSRPKEAISLLPLEVALAVAGFLENEFAVTAAIKWPNDLLVDGKKIAGTLIEAKFNGDLAYLAIGIGINVAAVETTPGATSVEALRGSSVDLAAVLPRFVQAIDTTLAITPDRGSIIETWRRRTIHRPGERVTATIGSVQLEGTWEGIDDDGRAAIRTAEGVIHVAGGEIIRSE